MISAKLHSIHDGSKIIISWIPAVMPTLDPNDSSSQTPIFGIHDLKQDPFHYFAPQNANRNLISLRDQERLAESFNRLYFLPWHQKAPLGTKGKILEPFRKCKENPGRGQEKIRHGIRGLKEIESFAQLEVYPNMALRGITVSNSNLRLLPTGGPIYKRFPGSGEGYAFDEIQYSAIPPGMPVYISHSSREKDWFLIESHYGAGWILAKDVAIVDRDFIRRWTKEKFAALTKDGTALSDENGRNLFIASVGCLFPVNAEGKNHFEILIAKRMKTGKAQIGRVILSKDYAALIPFPLVYENVSRIIRELLNKAYGWGGVHGNRDCSSTMKDLFTPFGVWLPRDSGEQAYAGRFILLKGLSLQEKEQRILKDGVPFLTLLWIPGHIMLLIGSHSGKAVVFHNMWSTVVRDSQGKERERIVGKSVISDLYAGEEPGRSRLSRIEGMALLGK